MPRSVLRHSTVRHLGVKCARARGQDEDEDDAQSESELTVNTCAPEQTQGRRTFRQRCRRQRKLLLAYITGPCQHMKHDGNLIKNTPGYPVQIDLGC